MTELDKIRKLEKRNEQFNKAILLLVDYIAENLVEIKELKKRLTDKEQVN